MFFYLEKFNQNEEISSQRSLERDPLEKFYSFLSLDSIKSHTEVHDITG